MLLVVLVRHDGRQQGGMSGSSLLNGDGDAGQVPG